MYFSHLYKLKSLNDTFYICAYDEWANLMKITFDTFSLKNQEVILNPPYDNFRPKNGPLKPLRLILGLYSLLCRASCIVHVHLALNA